MRFPYLGVTRINYLYGMLARRRLVRRIEGWPATSDFEDTQVAALAEAPAARTEPTEAAPRPRLRAGRPPTAL